MLLKDLVTEGPSRALAQWGPLVACGEQGSSHEPLLTGHKQKTEAWPSPDRQHQEGRGRHKHTLINRNNRLDGNQNSLDLPMRRTLRAPPKRGGRHQGYRGEEGVRVAIECHTRRHWNVYRKWQHSQHSADGNETRHPYPSKDNP